MHQKNHVKITLTELSTNSGQNYIRINTSQERFVTVEREAV